MKIGLCDFHCGLFLVRGASVSNASQQLEGYQSRTNEGKIIKKKNTTDEQRRLFMAVSPAGPHPGMWKSPAVNISSANSIGSGDRLFWVGRVGLCLGLVAPGTHVYLPTGEAQRAKHKGKEVQTTGRARWGGPGSFHMCKYRR